MRLLSNLSSVGALSPDHRRGRLRRCQRRHRTRRAPSGLGADRARQPLPGAARSSTCPGSRPRGWRSSWRCSQRRGAGGDRADRRPDRVLGRAIGARRSGGRHRLPGRDQPAWRLPLPELARRDAAQLVFPSTSRVYRTRRCARWSSMRGRRALRFATRRPPRACRAPGSPSASGSWDHARLRRNQARRRAADRGVRRELVSRPSSTAAA